MIGRVVLGRYRIVDALARGGMGVVYLARSEGASGFHKPVVVKRMASDLMVETSMARMFVREARLMSQLRHPGLVGVVDFGEERGDYLMIIEYVHGYHLGQWHRYFRQTRGPFPADLVIHIMVKVLEALHYAHELKGADGKPLKIVHRDVSPSNILIDVEGHVKLADFGVARSRDQTEQTEASTIKGKMPYLAPELFHLEDPSAASDAYACGVVLHELLVGRNEFRAGDVAATVSRVLEHTPTPVDAVRDDLPDGLGEVLAKSLQKDPKNRYQTTAEFARALREVRVPSEDDVQAELYRAAQRDFMDPQIAVILGIRSLNEREDGWRNPSSDVLAREHEVERRYSSSPPTMVEGSNVFLPQKKRWPWVVAAVGALALVSAGIALATMPPTQAADPQILIVDRSSGNDDTTSETVQDTIDDVPTSTVEDAAVAVADDDAGSTVVPPIVRPATSRDLTRAFQQQQGGRISGCYETHDMAGTSIVIRFTVGRRGNVSNVSLSPSSHAGSAFGQCILSAARGTRFPAPQREVSFSIPVSVRSSSP